MYLLRLIIKRILTKNGIEMYETYAIKKKDNVFLNPIKIYFDFL